MPRRPCLRCSKLTTHGSFCPACTTWTQLQRRGIDSGWQWSALRRQVLKRDHWTCQRCGFIGEPDELEVDHITPLKQGGKSEESNLQTLCNYRTPSNCHGAKTKREAA